MSLLPDTVFAARRRRRLIAYMMPPRLLFIDLLPSPLRCHSHADGAIMLRCLHYAAFYTCLRLFSSPRCIFIYVALCCCCCYYDGLLNFAYATRVALIRATPFIDMLAGHAAFRVAARMLRRLLCRCLRGAVMICHMMQLPARARCRRRCHDVADCRLPPRR